MISPELLRRYRFFAGLSMDHITTLARAAEEEAVDEGHYFFREGDDLRCLCIVLEGAVAVVMELPDQTVAQPLSGQLTGDLETKDLVISTVGPGEAFAWSSLVPPFEATASVKATTQCRVIHIDAATLREAFEGDCEFGYLMMQKTAQVIRDRLHATRIQALPYFMAA